MIRYKENRDGYKMNEHYNNGKLRIKKKSNWLLISIIFLLIIFLLSLTFYFFINSPKYVIKQSVIRTSNKLEKFISQHEKNVQFNSTMKLKENILNDKFADNIFKINGFYKQDNKQFQLDGSILNNDEELLDGMIFYDKDKTFIKSDSLLSNVYDISNVSCGTDNEFICLLNVLHNNQSMDLGLDKDKVSLNNALEGLEQAIIGSISNDNVYRNKGVFKDTNVNYNKYTFVLNKETIKYIFDNLNDSAKYYLYIITYNLFDDISSLEDLDKELNNKINEIKNPIEINIYTNGIFNKFVGIEVGNNSDFLKFSYDKILNKLELSFPKNNIKLETNGNLENKVEGLIYVKNKEVVTFNYVKDGDVTTLNCQSNVLGTKLNIDINSKLRNSQNNLEGTLVIDISLDTFIYNINVELTNDYTISNDITISPLDTSKALTYDSMPQEEKDEVNAKMKKFLQKFIGDLSIFD